MLYYEYKMKRWGVDQSYKENLMKNFESLL